MRLDAVTEADWERWRDLRLRMLADTPTAFAETLGHALEQDEEEWRFRASRTCAPGSFARVAVDEATGEWVGTMSAYTSPADGLFLVGVFVDARVRGAGVSGALLDAVLTWARAQPGADGVRLHVHEDNLRAQAFYLRKGFVATGVRTPYGLDPTREELEMRLSFAPSSADRVDPRPPGAP